MGDIQTEDGIIIRGWPDGKDPLASPELKSFVSNIRQTTGPGEYNFSPSPVNVPSAQRQGTQEISQAQQPQEGFTPKASTQFPSFQQIPQAEDSKPKTTLEGLAGGVVRELAPVVTATGIAGPAGGAAVTLAKIVGDPITRLVNSVFGDELKAKFGREFTEPSEALELIFDKIGIAEPKSEAEKVLQAMSRGVAETAGTLGLGQTLQAGKGLAQTTAKGIGQTLTSQPVQQITGAVGSEAASKTAELAGAGPVVQTIAGLGGGMLGSGLSNVKTVPTPTAPIKEAKEAGVRLLTSDVKPPSTFASRFGQSIGEKIPVFGTGSVRQMQQVERVAATKDLLRQFSADDIANISDDIMDDLIKTRTGKFNLYGKNKSDVIKKLSGKPVPVDKTISAIDDQISQLQSLNTQEVQPVIDRLVDWKGAVQDQDLQNIELLRKQLGESFKGQEMVNVRSIGEKALSSIYGAVKEDMTDYIRVVGGDADVNKWMNANKMLSKTIGELDNAALKRVLNKGEATPELVKNALFSKNKSDVKALYKNLSPEGRASARSAILAKAAEGSNFVGSDDISPDKFANAVKKLGIQTGVFFEKQDLEQVEGLMRVLNATKRAGQAAAAPPTGIQNLLPVGAAGTASFFGGGLEGFLGAMATGAGIGTTARIYESKPIRDILIKIPRVAAGSPQEAALFKRLNETARAMQNKEEK